MLLQNQKNESTKKERIDYSLINGYPADTKITD